MLFAGELNRRDPKRRSVIFSLESLSEPLIGEACRVLYSLSVLPVDNAPVKDLAIFSETGLVRLVSRVSPDLVATVFTFQEDQLDRIGEVPLCCLPLHISIIRECRSSQYISRRDPLSF